MEALRLRLYALGALIGLRRLAALGARLGGVLLVLRLRGRGGGFTHRLGSPFRVLASALARNRPARLVTANPTHPGTFRCRDPTHF